jgi:hypothetical protein
MILLAKKVNAQNDAVLAVGKSLYPVIASRA